MTEEFEYEAKDHSQEGWLEAIHILRSQEYLPKELLKRVLPLKNDSGENLLHWYLFYEADKNIFEKLIKNGFDINSKNKFNFSILYDLAMHQNMELIEIAIKYGAKIEVEENCDMNSWEYLSYVEFLDEIKKIKNKLGK